MFTTENIFVKPTYNNARVLTIETGIEQFNSKNTTIVVGEDIDFAVSGAHCLNFNQKKYLFFKTRKGSTAIKNVYIQKFIYFSICQNYILFSRTVTD